MFDDDEFSRHGLGPITRHAVRRGWGRGYTEPSRAHEGGIGRAVRTQTLDGGVWFVTAHLLCRGI